MTNVMNVSGFYLNLQDKEYLYIFKENAQKTRLRLPESLILITKSLRKYLWVAWSYTKRVRKTRPFTGSSAILMTPVNGLPRTRILKSHSTNGCHP